MDETSTLEQKETVCPPPPTSNKRDVREDWIAETVKFLRTRYKIITVGKVIFAYRGGCFREAEDELRQVITQRWEGVPHAVVNEVINRLIDQTGHRSFEFNPQAFRYINLQNGVFDIQEKKVLPHSSAYYFTYKSPVIYNSEAKCPEITSFLRSITDGQEKMAEDLKKICARILVAAPYEHKILILVGDGGNGKGTFIHLLESLAGKDNVVSIDLAHIESDRFMWHYLHGKRLAVAPDAPDKALGKSAMSTLKALSGGDKISADVKHKGRLEFIFGGICIFLFNRLPKLSEYTHGMNRRLVLIDFKVRFSNSLSQTGECGIVRQKVPEIINRITSPEELSGLFNELIPILEKIGKKEEIFSEAGSDAIRKKYEILRDPVASFLAEFAGENTQGGSIPKPIFLRLVRRYIRKHDTDLTEQAISRRIKESQVPITTAEKCCGKLRYEVYTIPALIWEKIRPDLLEETYQFLQEKLGPPALPGDIFSVSYTKIIEDCLLDPYMNGDTISKEIAKFMQIKTQKNEPFERGNY